MTKENYSFEILTWSNFRKKLRKVWPPKFDSWLGASNLTFSNGWNVTAECGLITCTTFWQLPVSHPPALHFYLNCATEIHMGISCEFCHGFFSGFNITLHNDRFHSLAMAHALRQTTAVHTRFGPVSGRSYKAHGLT
jgi:hypothetical protein